MGLGSAVSVRLCHFSLSSLSTVPGSSCTVLNVSTVLVSESLLSLGMQQGNSRALKLHLVCCSCKNESFCKYIVHGHRFTLTSLMVVGLLSMVGKCLHPHTDHISKVQPVVFLLQYPDVGIFENALCSFDLNVVWIVYHCSIFTLHLFISHHLACT